MLRHLIRFAGVGAVATLLHYATLLMLVELLSLEPVLASTIGFATSAVFNYLGNYHFTFASDRPHAIALMKFVVVASIGLAVNTLGMYLLVDFLALQYLLAQLISTAIVVVWNFYLNRRWTYGIV